MIYLDGIACLLILILRFFSWTEIYVNAVSEYFTLQITKQFNRCIRIFLLLNSVILLCLMFLIASPFSGYLLILFISHLWECNGSFLFLFPRDSVCWVFLIVSAHVTRFENNYWKQFLKRSGDFLLRSLIETFL